MIRTLIVDDEPLARRRLQALLADAHDIELVGEAADGDAAVAAILQQRPDLVFLDVQLPERDGFAVLESVVDTYLPAVVFVTAFDRYAVAAFEARALDYLLKPFSRARLQQALEVVRERRTHSPGPAMPATAWRTLLAELRGDQLERLAVSRGRDVHFVDITEIDWVQTEGNYLRVHAGGATHIIRGTLKALEDRLDPARFLRVRRDTLVCVASIRSIQPWSAREHTLIMRDDARIISTASYNRAVRALMRNPL